MKTFQQYEGILGHKEIVSNVVISKYVRGRGRMLPYQGGGRLYLGGGGGREGSEIIFLLNVILGIFSVDYIALFRWW